MTTVVLGEHPDVTALLARRRALGQDGHDEMWEGVYHMAPYAHSRHGKVESELHGVLRPYARAAGLSVSGPFNLGEPEDFRVPDLAVRDPGLDAVYLPTARIVVEVLSPDDETYAKFGFYARHQVAEILVADPESSTVHIWVLIGDGYREVARSVVLDVSADALAAAIDWP